MKPLIINVHASNPPYAFASSQDRPDHSWPQPDGTWVGVWTREWPALLGEAVLNASDRYAWEVWQTDCRAKQVYSVTWNSGVIHRLFPATERVYRPGIRRQAGVYSEALLARLADAAGLPVVLHLHGFRNPFYGEIVVRCGMPKRFPIWMVGHGMSVAPLSEMRGWHRPLTYACLLVEHWKLSRLLRAVDVVSAQSEYARGEVKKVFAGRTELLTMGCDFDFWTPVPSAKQKTAVRNDLGLPPSRTAFIATGNFVPLKQFDKLIEVFGRLSARRDFVLVIAGHGDEGNTKRLQAASRPLVREGKAILHPYVTGERLRNLYWASDVYVSVSTDEGASVSVMKAMACGLPVLATPVGGTSERMRRHGVGRFIPVDGYEEWKVAIEEILDKGLPPALDRAVAKEAYDWPQVARRFIGVYEDMLRDRFNSRVVIHG